MNEKYRSQMVEKRGSPLRTAHIKKKTKKKKQSFTKDLHIFVEYLYRNGNVRFFRKQENVLLFFTGEMNHPTLSRARRGLVRMSHYFCFRQNWKRNEFNCKEFTTKKLERKTRWRRKGIRSGAIHKLHNASLDNGSITLVNKCNLRPTKIHYKHQRD